MDTFYKNSVGKFGVRPKDFWKLTLKEYILIAKGYYEVKSEEYKHTWEVARWQAFINLQPHIKKNSISNPLDLIKFEWENNTSESMSIKESEKIFNNIFPKHI